MIHIPKKYDRPDNPGSDPEEKPYQRQGPLWDGERNANFTLQMGSPQVKSPETTLPASSYTCVPQVKKAKQKPTTHNAPPPQDQVKALKEDLARLKVLATASALPDPSLAAEAVGLECPVCLQRPERIFCCHVRSWAQRVQIFFRNNERDIYCSKCAKKMRQPKMSPFYFTF